MTEFKAIEILSAHREYYEAVEQQLQTAPLCEALEMAITALQENKEHKEIDARLGHLLQSKFIASFDTKHPRYGKDFELGGEYVRDIKDADRLGALLDLYTSYGGFEFSISQLKDLIKDRESLCIGDADADEVFKNDIKAIETAITAMQTHDKAAKIINRLEQQDGAAIIASAAERLIINLPEIVNKAIEQLPQAIAKAAMMIENRQEQGELESLIEAWNGGGNEKEKIY